MSRSIPAFFLLLLLHGHAYSQAETKINQTDARGRKQGYWKKIEQGNVKYQGSFKDDKPVGEFIYYYPAGTIKAKTFFSDQGARSYSLMFHPGGKKMAAGKFIGNKKDSTWVYFNEEEQPVSSVQYKNGLKHGLSRTFFPGGKVNEDIYYIEDQKDGEWKQYFPDGSLKLKATYVKGLLQGLTQAYHTNGKVMVSGIYKDSLKDGIWMYFDDVGRAQIKETWAKGFRIGEEYLDKKLLEERVRLDSIK